MNNQVYSLPNRYTLRISKKINVFVILTLVVFLTPVLMQITKNNYVKLIEDLAYLTILMQSVYIMLLQNYIYVKKNAIAIIFIVLFLVFTFVGMYYNGISILILQYREFKYILLLIIMIPYTDKEYFKNIWVVIKSIVLLSIPVSLFQWLKFGSAGDHVTGLFGYGGSGTLTLVSLIAFFVELTMRLQKNNRITGLYLFFIIPTLINETKITLLLIPILLLISLILSKRLNLKNIVFITTLLIMVVSIWAYAYKKTNNISILEVFSSEYIENYLYATNWDTDAGRLAKIKYAFEIIRENKKLLFGYGLGASYSGVSSGAKGYIYEKYYSPQMFEGTKPQMFLSLIDLGLFGYSCLLLILVVIFIKIINIKQNNMEKCISIYSFIILFITLLYQNIFYTYQIMYILLLYTILCLREYNSHETTVTEKNILAGI